jgi:hypothetical protein
MMDSVSSKFPTAKKLVTWISQQLHDVETKRDTSDGLLRRCDDNLNDLSRLLHSLHQLVQQEPPQRRQMWRRRVDQLGEEAATLRAAHGRAAAAVMHARGTQCEFARLSLLALLARVAFGRALIRL